MRSDQIKGGQIFRILGMVASSASILLLTGCFSSSYSYGESKSTGTYFRVPHDWHEITQSALTKVESASSDATVQERLSLLRWADAYAQSPATTPSEVLSNKVVLDTPIAFAQVRYLNGTEINEASYNTLRDLVLPITHWADGSVTGPADLNIIDDAEVIQKGASGMHTRISFTGSSKVSEIFDQTALLSLDRRSIHVLIVRCSSSCFTKNASTLEKIVKSFTVRGAQ